MPANWTLLLASFTFVGLAHAECSARAGAERPRLVELYTSEGCSSCPPADTWLRAIPARSNLVALAFHVDYWDALGWRDRFADSRYTARQQQQAARDGSSTTFTPQVVLDGRNWIGWYRGSPAAPAAAANAAMRVDATPGNVLRVRMATTFDAPADGAGFHNYLALTENGLGSEVRAGENRGAHLRHDHVVRALAGPLPLAVETELTLPPDLDRAQAHLVAFAQRGDGAVGQVLECALP